MIEFLMMVVTMFVLLGAGMIGMIVLIEGFGFLKIDEDALPNVQRKDGLWEDVQ